MRLFGMGMPELLVILVVILIIFGPKNLPKLGSALGKAVKGVREGVDSVTEELGVGKDGAAAAAPAPAAAATAATPAAQAAQTTVVVEDVPVATPASVATPTVEDANK